MPRITAWNVLRSGSSTPMRDVSRAAEKAGLEPRDRGLLRQLVGTEVRRRATLRAIVQHFSRTTPSADLAAHMRLGVCQLLFLDQIPDHAAVSETVEATVRTLGTFKRKYVNALLRTVARARSAGKSGDPQRDLIGRDMHLAAPVFRDPKEHPLLWAEEAYSIPAPLIKRWMKRLGEERALKLAEGFLTPPPLSLRVTGSRDEAAAELRAMELEVRESTHPAILILPKSSTEAVVASEAFQAGRLTVQGETALRAAELVEASEGERILDLCAAPGGKTAVLAGAGAQVTACDIDPKRLEPMLGTLERMQLTERVEIVALDLEREDQGLLATDFDAALVDAPCSNTGVLGARPGARWRFGPAAQASLRELQSELIERAAFRVRPGGRLVYSTCSTEPDENGQRVRAFLAEHPDWQLEHEHEALPASFVGDPAPDELGGPVDGGYAARLTRSPRA